MAFAFEGIATPAEIAVDVYTDAYRISGTVRTPFKRVAEILNQLTGAHLTLGQASISEHADPAVTVSAPTALVAVESIILMIAPALAVDGRSDMRIEKRAIRAQLAAPPFRITGKVHVVVGSRPVDGVLNLLDRFMPMTDATVTSARHPELERTASVLAVRRDRAQVLLVADDEQPEEALVADTADQGTAEDWLRPREEGA